MNPYRIEFYDHAGAMQLYLAEWNRLEYHQRLNAGWNHQITIEAGLDDPLLDDLRAIEDDWIVRIYRTDTLTHVTALVYEGFNTTIVDQMKINGSIVINLYGVGFVDLIKRRLVVPPPGSAHLEITGYAEDVIKAFVSQSAVNPTDTLRKQPGLTIDLSGGLGSTVTYQARYTNLLTVCTTVSEQGNIKFGVKGGDTVGTFIFTVRDIWGTDRRTTLAFDVLYGNMSIPIFSRNSSEEKNFVYVGGEGEEENRNIQEVRDVDAVARTPWSRKELFIDARQQTEDEALTLVGLDTLRERKKKQSLSFSVQQTAQTRWPRDWGLGDWVASNYFGFLSDKEIEGVKVTVSREGQYTEGINADMREL